jgi:hypothetical protein
VLQLDEPTHTYRWNGSVVPSVSTLLAPLNQYAGVPEEVLRLAAERGTDVHLACHYDDLGTLDESTVDERCAGYLAADRKFKAEHHPIVLGSEVQVYHPSYRYAGTFDLRCKIGPDYALIDRKTCAQLHWCMGVQLAAYDMAYRAMQVATLPSTLNHKRYVLHLRPDGNYRLVPYTDPMDARVFVALASVYHARRHYG